MSSRSFRRSGHALLLALSALLDLRSAAAAQSCTADGGCAKGFECKVVEVPCAAAVPSCKPGQDCPATPIACEPQTYTECVPGSCSTDSDCSAGMVCHEEVTAACAGSGSVCRPGADCDELPPVTSECTTTTTRSCVAQWTLPCTGDASCGEGFTCVADPDSCGCSAGAPVSESGGGSTGSVAPSPPNSGAEALPAPEAPDCTCTPSTTKHCEAKTITCAADSDCPSAWTCVETGVGSGDACPSGVATALADGGVIAQPAPACDVAAPPPSTSKQCVPPYGSYSGVKDGNAVGLPSSTSEGAAGVGSANPPRTPASGDAIGATPVPASDSASSGASTSHGATEDPMAESTTDSGGGCQLGGRRTGASSALLLALFGLASLVRRKRES